MFIRMFVKWKISGLDGGDTVPNIMFEVDELTYQVYQRLRRRLKAKKHPETVKSWFIRRVEEYDRRLYFASHNSNDSNEK